MMTAMKNGEYIFEPSQCLSPNQIKSFFRRLTRKRRRQSQMQVKYASEEPEDDVSEDENESLHHAQLMEISLDVLKKKTVQKYKPQQSSPSSPSTIRKLDSRSNDDLTKHPPIKRASKNK